MTDTGTYYQPILEKPFDDLPRLIYADRLEEYGDTERAEFIRLQIRISELPNRCLKNKRQLDDCSSWTKSNFVNNCRCEVCSTRRNSYLIGRKHTSTDWCPYVTIINEEMESIRPQLSGDNYNDPLLKIKLKSPPFAVCWRRGFPDEVIVSTMEGWCGNIGVAGGTNDPEREGLAKRVCERWPVTAATMLDRKPAEVPGEVHPVFMWYLRNPAYEMASWHLYSALYHKLIDETGNPPMEWLGHVRYEDKDNAMTALKRAAGNLGRHRAGLEMVEWS